MPDIIFGLLRDGFCLGAVEPFKPCFGFLLLTLAVSVDESFD